MSPAQPPRPGPGGKPGPGKQPQPEHPAERASPNPAQRPPGKYVEVRKGQSGARREEEVEDDAPIGNVSLPRSITQEQEQADLKHRLGREELVDIDKRNSLVKVTANAAEAASTRRRSSGLLLLLLVVLIATAAIVAEKTHFLDKLKGRAPAGK